MKKINKKITSTALVSTLLITTLGSTSVNAYTSDTTETSNLPSTISEDLQQGEPDLVKEGYTSVGYIEDFNLNDFELASEEIVPVASQNTTANVGIRPLSITGIMGPISGAVKKGNPVYRSKYANYSTAALAASAIASLTGAPASKVMSAYGSLMTALQALGTSDVYYIRQEYVSKTGEMYYYQYKYYKWSNYTGYLGTSYSMVYGKW